MKNSQNGQKNQTAIRALSPSSVLSGTQQTTFSTCSALFYDGYLANNLIDLYTPTEQQVSQLFQLAINTTDLTTWPDCDSFDIELKERLRFELRDRVYTSLKQDPDPQQVHRISQQVIAAQAQDIVTSVFGEVVEEYRKSLQEGSPLVDGQPGINTFS